MEQPQNSPRVKFILLGHPRSGSTLVTLALQSHPEIRMFGELFHADFYNRLIAFGSGIRCHPSEQMNPKKSNGWAYTDHQEGNQFLDELVFGDSSKDAPLATGFKLFYKHARSGPKDASAWDYLRRHEEVRIIHLVRPNLLDCFLSKKTAEFTKIWEIEAGKPVPEVGPAFSFDPHECELYFHELMESRKTALSDLASDHRPFLNINYDELLADFDDVLNRIQKFLGVEIGLLPQALQRQSDGSTKTRLLNYDQMQAHFKDTNFAPFFVTNGS
jgi:LPS sulfotransferase NodH